MTMTVTPKLAVHASAAACVSCDVRWRSVCGALSEDHLDRLASVAVVREYGRGETFIDEGEAADHFFNITGGTAKLFKLLPDGRQHVTGFASVGHFLGLAVSDTYAFSAQAIEPVRVCRFSRGKLQVLLADFPALEHRLLQTACNELVIAQEQMLTLGRKTAQERVASFLIAWSHVTDCDHASDRVPLPMTRGEIADHLGLTIETVSRVFSRFRAAGRIQTPSHAHILILDRPWLEELATGGG
jgi:CRP/FNR family transcriptional regulator